MDLLCVGVRRSVDAYVVVVEVEVEVDVLVEIKVEGISTT